MSDPQQPGALGASVQSWFDCRRLGMWILGETWHSPQASFLRQFRVGPRGIWLRLPADKSRNSWRWLLWRLGPMRPVHSIRLTLPTRYFV